MNESNTAPATETSLGQDILALLQHWLRGRRGLVVLALLVLAAGMYSSWGWLVAAGIAPILLALAPCAAMCAAGLCMNRGGGSSCNSGKESAGDVDVPDNPLGGSNRPNPLPQSIQRKENSDG